MMVTVDGKPVEDAQASGLSYPVGSESLLDGLDEALIGMSAGDSKTFSSELAGGDFAGQEADVTVTVHSVKAKDVPGLDDDFAQMASEFDTLGELRADTRTQLERDKAMRQVMQARDLALDALLDQVDIPLPESVVADEVQAQPGVDRGPALPGRRQPGRLPGDDEPDRGAVRGGPRAARRSARSRSAWSSTSWPGTRNSASTRPS